MSPICIECKFLDHDAMCGFPVRVDPNIKIRPVITDFVNGIEIKSPIKPRDARTFEGHCGASGKWFSPKNPK